MIWSVQIVPLTLIFSQIKFCLLWIDILASKQYSASIAFTLALFSHLVNHVNIRLQAELEEGESVVTALRTDYTGVNKSNALLFIIGMRL